MLLILRPGENPASPRGPGYHRDWYTVYVQPRI